MEDNNKNFNYEYSQPNQARENITSQGAISKFLHFDNMITPSIIKIIYFISMAIIALLALGMITQGGLASFGGIILFLLSPILPRLYCELLIVKFKTLETLQEIRDQNK